MKENFTVFFLEALKMCAEILQLRGADEGEVGRIEKEDGPVAQQVLLGVKAAFPPAVAVDCKVFQGLSDQMAHGGAPFSCDF